MREARRRGRRGVTLGLAALALLGVAAFADPAPRLVWNASASAPLGLYRVVAGKPARGDLVLVRTPEAVLWLADARGYLPADVPLIKRVTALSGDHLCAEGDAVSVNGRVVALRLAADGLGRPLPRWSACRALRGDELFLLMEGVPGSFDGRYFGPVRLSAVIGRLAPLWVRRGREEEGLAGSAAGFGGRERGSWPARRGDLTWPRPGPTSTPASRTRSSPPSKPAPATGPCRGIMTAPRSPGR